MQILIRSDWWSKNLFLIIYLAICSKIYISRSWKPGDVIHKTGKFSTYFTVGVGKLAFILRILMQMINLK